MCHTPYLRKHTSYDHDFWYTSCVLNDGIPRCFFSFFQNFDFLGCQGGGGKMEKMAQNDKKFSLPHSIGCKKAKNDP